MSLIQHSLRHVAMKLTCCVMLKHPSESCLNACNYIHRCTYAMCKAMLCIGISKPGINIIVSFKTFKLLSTYEIIAAFRDSAVHSRPNDM